jgi:transcriptional regulator with XRE-family HTH domain
VPPFVSPTVRRRRLAAELRRLRDRAHLTGDEVATRLGWSPSKVSRYELARGGLKPVEVRRLLDLYAVEEPRRGELLALAREATDKGWWDEYSDAFAEEYIALIGMEAEASAEWGWHLDVVPGLLQTESYMRANIDQLNALEPTPPSKIDRSVAVRLRRQRILRRDPPLQYAVVLDEAVLRRQLGQASVMREQLAHLIEVTALPNVSLRVMPLAGANPIVMNSFDMLRIGSEETTMPDVVWTELLTATLHFEGEADTFRYHLLFETLSASAMPPAESVELIDQIMAQVWT